MMLHFAVSQRDPKKSLVQLQVPSLLHVPPLRQGDVMHWSMEQVGPL